jgi:4'-phosphopantetheinyl transferase
MQEPSDAVQVWWAEPDALVAAMGTELLSDDERDRATHFRFERDRTLSLATRLLARTTLSRYVATAPAAWRFTTTAFGRPLIDPPSRLNFNLSNTHGLVVCAVAWDAELGVDVEHLDRAAPLEVASHSFAPSELAQLVALPRSNQTRRFFDYWTLKESYIKARGLGLNLPLDRFAIDLVPGQAPRLVIDPSLNDDGASWQLAQHCPSEAHLIAVCARRTTLGADRVIEWHRALATS